MGKIQEIGDRLFEKFHEEIFSGRHKSRKKISPQETREIADAGLRRLYEAALAEREKHGLGMIARARVAFYLQKRLLAAGYPPPLVRQLLFSLLVAAFVK